MSTYLVYRIVCQTDDKHEYWTLLDSDPAPTTCPTDTNHTVDTSSVTVVKTISDTIVRIREESTETGGNFCCETLVVDCATGPGVQTTADFSWPIPISVLDMKFTIEDEHRGDWGCNILAPDTITGILTATAATGATGITVNSTVIDNAMVGYEMNLLNGSDTEELGRILSIDTTNSKITMENATTQSFPAFSTYVRQSVITVRDFEFGPPETITIGDCKIGGSYIPTGIVSRIIYTNNSDYAKKFITHIEYLY